MSKIDLETGEVLEETADTANAVANTYEVDIVSGKVTNPVFTLTERGIATLREKYPATLTTDDYQIIVAGVKEIRKLCINLEAARKKIKAPFLNACRVIDQEARRITNELEQISDPMVDIKKQVDDAKAIEEAQRLAALDEKASYILQIAKDAEYGTLAEISTALEQVNAIDTLNGFYERQLVACENKALAMATLKAALVRRNDQDRRDREAEQARQALAAAQAELAKQQAEAEALLEDERAKAKAEREELEQLRAEAALIKQERQAKIVAENEAKIQATELAESEADKKPSQYNKPDATALQLWRSEALKELDKIKLVNIENESYFEEIAQGLDELVNDAIIEMVG